VALITAEYLVSVNVSGWPRSVAMELRGRAFCDKNLPARSVRLGSVRLGMGTRYCCRSAVH